MAARTEDATPEAPPTRYRVTAEYIMVKTAGLAGIIPGRGGYCVVGLYRGALLPADVPAESIEHHLSSGMIEAVPA